jgi:hypothetical protein
VVGEVAFGDEIIRPGNVHCKGTVKKREEMLLDDGCERAISFAA